MPALRIARQSAAATASIGLREDEQALIQAGTCRDVATLDPWMRKDAQRDAQQPHDAKNGSNRTHSDPMKERSAASA
jgi:hypothetical protein